MVENKLLKVSCLDTLLVSNHWTGPTTWRYSDEPCGSPSNRTSLSQGAAPRVEAGRARVETENWGAKVEEVK